VAICDDENFRSARHQRLAQFDQHGFHFRRLVLDPAQCLEATRAVHDRGGHFIGAISDRLHCLSRPRWRKVVRLSRMAGGDLFSDVGFARSARVRDAASRYFNTHPGV